MKRRVFLGGVAAGVASAAASVAAGYLYHEATQPPPTRGHSFSRFEPRPRPTESIAPVALPYRVVPPTISKVPLPHHAIYDLPGDGNLLALTVDDGTSSEVVRGYAQFAHATGMRLTFFLNGVYPSWTDNAALLRPLVDSGQIQLANHTWTHPDLTTLTNGQIASQLQRNHNFIRNTYGVDAKPFFRPPYGAYDDRVEAVADSIGYTTPVMWYGSLADSSLIAAWQLKSFADRWFLAQHIVIGHANHETVTHCFDYLLGLIQKRHLQPVTLDDVFNT